MNTSCAGVPMSERERARPVLAIIGVTANKNDIPTSVGDRGGSAGLSHVMEWK